MTSDADNMGTEQESLTVIVIVFVKKQEVLELVYLMEIQTILFRCMRDILKVLGRFT